MQIKSVQKKQCNADWEPTKV